MKELQNKEYVATFTNNVAADMLLSTVSLPLIITHKDMDGAGVALSVISFIDRTVGSVDIDKLDIMFHQHGEDFSDTIMSCVGRNVIMGDFTMSLPEMEEIKKVSKNFLCVDHHKSAAAKLGHLEYCVFDMEMAGCTLMYNVLMPKLEIPELLLYVEDRDIWKWELPMSKEINAGLALISFYDIEALYGHLHSPMSGFEVEGKAILAYQNTQVDKVVDRYKEDDNWCTINGVDVPFINVNHLISEVGNDLSSEYPFCAMYFFTKDSIVVSFRSNADNPEHMDVSEIAKGFGGGGLKHAAGCSFKLYDIDLNALFGLMDLNVAVKMGEKTLYTK